jgi:putative ABC transport system permease protein
MIPLRYNLRSLLVRRTSTVTTVFGIALVVFVLASALMLSAGVKKTMSSSGRPDVAIVLGRGSDSEMASGVDDTNLGLLAAQPGVAKDGGHPLVAGELVMVLGLEKLGQIGSVSNVQIRGIQADSPRFRSNLHYIAGRAAQPGTSEVAIGARLRGRFRSMELGQTFELRRNRPVTVVGVFEAGGTSYESEIWGDLDTLRSAFGRVGNVSSVRLLLESPERFEGIRAAIEEDKRLGLSVMREPEYFDKVSEGTSIFVTALGTTIAVFLSLGAMVGAMITMYAGIAHRQREIGTLLALGFGRLQILVAFLLESLILALGGGVVGCLGALALGTVKLSMMNFQSWSEMVFSFDPNPQTLLTAMVFALVMGLLGGFLPAVRAARMSPLEAMRG